MILNKNNLNEFSKRKTKKVKINGFEVYLIEMTVPQQLEIETLLKDSNKGSDSEVLIPMIKFCVVDENMNQVFDDNSVKDLPSNLAANLFRECVEFNSLSESDLEQLAKN